MKKLGFTAVLLFLATALLAQATSEKNKESWWAKREPKLSVYTPAEFHFHTDALFSILMEAALNGSADERDSDDANFRGSLGVAFETGLDFRLWNVVSVGVHTGIGTYGSKEFRAQYNHLSLNTAFYATHPGEEGALYLRLQAGRSFWNNSDFVPGTFYRISLGGIGLSPKEPLKRHRHKYLEIGFSSFLPDGGIQEDFKHLDITFGMTFDWLNRGKASVPLKF